jgi:hypothetical protein
MRMILALLFVALLVPAAQAQKSGPNGGMLAGKGGHETELVITPTELTVYIIDGGKAHSTKGVSLRAVVQQGGKSTTVALVDVENKKLVGKLEAPLASGAIVVVTGKDDHGDAVTARYTIK